MGKAVLALEKSPGKPFSALEKGPGKPFSALEEHYWQRALEFWFLGLAVTLIEYFKYAVYSILTKFNYNLINMYIVMPLEELVLS